MDTEFLKITSWVWNNSENSTTISAIIASLIIGFLVKNVQDKEAKKWLGTGFGISMIYFVGGFTHLWHVMLYGIAGAMIVTNSGKRSCNKTAFIFMFAYITLYRIYVNFFNSHLNNTLINFVQMLMICKIVGVAYEISKSTKTKEAIKKGYENISDAEIVEPDLSDIIHYAFSCFGIFFGPYVTYRTFNDYLTLPFSRTVAITATIKKICMAVVLSCIYLTIDYYWPKEYCLSKEFQASDFFYQSLFIIIQFHRYVFWISAGCMWGESICSAAGLGAYPSIGMNKIARGPYERYAVIKNTTYEEAQKIECDFKTLKSMDLLAIEVTPWMRVQIENWNRSIQYFMWKSAQQSLPNAELLEHSRLPIFIVFALWCGIKPGILIGVLTLPGYTFTEILYKPIIDKNLKGWKSDVALACMLLLRVYMSGFTMTVFSLGDFNSVYNFCTSIYFMPYIVHLCMQLLGIEVVNYFHKIK